MNLDKDCIFCKIINGDIPCAKLYEDENVFAFLDIAPVNKGHALVIPKNHAVDFLDMSEDDIKNVFTAAQKVAKAVLKGTGADGFNIGMNNRKAAGQLVFHAHLHIMPRFDGDGLELWKGKKYEECGMDKVKEEILKNLQK